MQKQQHGVITVLDANRTPLFDAANSDKPSFVNALRRQNRILLGVAGAHERNQFIEFAIFRVNGWRCSRRLLALCDLPKHSKTQTEEQKATSEDQSDHTGLLRDCPKCPDTT